MKEVHKSAIEKSIVWLKAAGCTFAIIDADGNKYGDLDVKEKKTRKRTSPYPYGELAAYVSTYLKDLKVGEVGEVPLGKYDRPSIQSSCSSWMCRVFGNGSHTTALDPKRKVIEVLRIS